MQIQYLKNKMRPGWCIRGGNSLSHFVLRLISINCSIIDFTQLIKLNYKINAKPFFHLFFTLILFVDSLSQILLLGLRVNTAERTNNKII